MTVALALVLALVAPGAGQIFNGFFLRGILFGFFYACLVSVLLPLTVRAFHITDRIKLLNTIKAFNIVYAVVIFLSVVDALFYAFAQRHGGVSGLRLLYAALFCLAFMPMHHNLGKPFFADALSGMAGFSKLLPRHRRNK